MKYCDMEWLPIQTIAELWSKDEGTLPKEQLWMLLWKAIWEGEFETYDSEMPNKEDKGVYLTSWGNYVSGTPEEMQFLSGYLSPLDRVVSGPPQGTIRIMQILQLHALASASPRFARLMNEIFPLEIEVCKKPPPQIFKSLNSIPNLEERFKRMASYMPLFTLANFMNIFGPEPCCSCENKELRPDEAFVTDDYVINSWNVTFGNVAVKTDKLIKWIKRCGYEMPHFLSNRPTEEKFAEKIDPNNLLKSVYRTGTAGAPTSKHLLLAEMQRRHKERKISPSLSSEVDQLLTWLALNHPQAAQPKKSSAENALRDDYRALVASAP